MNVTLPPTPTIHDTSTLKVRAPGAQQLLQRLCLPGDSHLPPGFPPKTLVTPYLQLAHLPGQQGRDLIGAW